MADTRWWVRMEDSEPLGPLPEEKILRGLVAGKVPLEALVRCEGGDWSPIASTAPFSTTVRLLSRRSIEHPSTLGRSLADETGEQPRQPPEPLPADPPGRRGLIACGVFFLLLAGVAGALTWRHPTRTAEGTVQVLLALFASGDVAALRARRDLGQKARMQAEVQQRGLQEMERRLQVLARAEAVAQSKLHDTGERVRCAGEAEFEKLSPDKQRGIRETSQLRYVLEQGLGALVCDDRALVPDVDALLDPGRRAALARRLGDRTLTDEERQQIASIKPGEAAADPATQRLVLRAMTAGDQEVQRLWRRVWMAGKEAFDALPPNDRQRITLRSRRAYVYTHGLPALTEQERSLITAPQLFFEDEAQAAKVKRRMAIESLPPGERDEVEELPVDNEQAAQAFVENHGVRLLSAELKSAFAAGGYALDTVSYRGRTPRSLLRSSSALAEVEMDPEREVAARRWLPERLHLRYDAGRYLIVGGDDKGASAALAEAPKPAEQAASDPHARQPHRLRELLGPEGLLLALIGSSFWLLVRHRPEGVVTSAEGKAAALALLVAALQHLGQGQVSLDDWCATPLYLAIPCVLGVRHGARSGYVGGVLVGLVLLAGATLFHLPAAASPLDLVPLGEYLLALLVLGALGAMAGVLAPHPLAAALLPLGWIVGSALLQREMLWSTSLYGRCALGVALTALALAMGSSKYPSPPSPLLVR